MENDILQNRIISTILFSHEKACEELDERLTPANATRFV